MCVSSSKLAMMCCKHLRFVLQNKRLDTCLQMFTSVQDIDIKQKHFDIPYYQAIGYHRRGGMAFQEKDGTPTCSEFQS